MAEASVEIEGFMVSSVGCPVLLRALWASGSLFSIIGLKTHTQKHKNRTGKDILFSCARPLGSIFIPKACIFKFNKLHYYINYS